MLSAKYLRGLYKMDMTLITQQIQTVAQEVAEMAQLGKDKLLVVGCSTSEVVGKRIGKGGSEDAAVALYEGLEAVRQRYGFAIAWQCCEHLNRALVIDRNTQESLHIDEVTVVPVPSAGGSMAAYVYRQLPDPVVVEQIRADAGIDIGDTLIGMHLKPVAVPLRPHLRQIGAAHITAARTRPKLIGGARAVYQIE
jgi:uncharacterized protein (TIGR01440 family)